MTRAELEAALEQQRTENATLRAELAEQRRSDGVPVAQVPASLWTYLLEETHTAVILCGPDGSVQWINKGFTALCGLELAEVQGRNPASFLRPNLRDPVILALIQDGIDRKVPFQYEVRNPRPGSEGWLRVRVQPVAAAAGGPASFVGLLEDITGWKQAQIGLVESEQRFRDLTENVPGVLYEWRMNDDGTFHFDYASPKLVELFGIHPRTLDRMMEFIHPDDLAGFRQSLDTATSNRAPWLHEFRIVAPGQPVRWMRGSSILTSSGPSWLGYSGILLDITPLRQAQAAMRESDIRWRLAVDGFGDGAWELNLQTKDIYYSADYKAMLGYQDDEFSNDYGTWLGHVHPDDLRPVLAIARAYLRGKSPQAAAEYRIQCKDGTYKWVMGRGQVTARDTAGEPLILTGLQTDITELKKAKEALDASSQRLSTVIANFQEGLVLEDENRSIVLANEAFSRLLEVPLAPAQLIGKAGAALAEGSRKFVKNPTQYVARINALLQRRLPVAGDRVSLRDGRILQRDFVPIFDQDRHLGHLWKYADITARTKAEADLRQREEKYRGIIENMSLGLVEADLNDHLLYANQSFCDMTGFSSTELAGQRLSPLLLTGDDLELVETKLHSRQQGIADSYEIAVTTKTGALKWLLVSGAPLYDDHRQHVGSIGIFLDVTPQKLLEASLREAKGLAEISTRTKQDFLANMSHEIRTPMNAILGMSQLLSKTSLIGPQTSYLHAITSSAENLLVIINDILDLSKIEAGHLAVEHIGFSPAQVCGQVEKTLHFKAEEKGLNFVTHLGPGLPDVLLGDPYRITQVLLNLAGNAVKFTEKGTVDVRCTLVAETHEAGLVVVEFAIQDTGIGIEAGFLAQVFDDFSQEDSSVTRQFGGTGLGLGISKKLVELMGGELRIESQKNQGTTSRFTLRLPIGTGQDVPHREGSDFTGLPHLLRGKRILLVEDNAFNRMLAAIFLTNSELVVTEALNGQVAVELARAQEFDLILMDVQMPVMNGYQATAVLREQLGLAVPIIALTANAITGEREKCLAAGMNDYLTKPFEEASLMKMVYDWVTVAQAAG
ncbi:PAS domain S-box protein [Hymenobacter antarcticus]|uniref:histidine kinase n=1 Tax=Hymenobacter antarcticus TaxID=486270 RepID=A0ABP7QTL9_9BACT